MGFGMLRVAEVFVWGIDSQGISSRSRPVSAWMEWWQIKILYIC